MPESTGDRAKLGRISKRGNKYLRPPRSDYDLKPGMAV
jgi:transposase